MRTRKRRMMNQINVVPYIDVTLVLLVIFMVTAPMTNPGVVELPKVGQALKQTGAPIVVTIKKDGMAEINGKRLQRDELLFEIKKQLETKERPVVVAADEKTQYGKVVEVMDLLKQAKVDKVGLLFKPAS
ncbi:ExbD/TolR family protein [Methylotenera versatilis]|uniref:ExbD/TolR family protein n=1 Tax=Methylotenera versatilis TaxID=1055487 RepID=UPI000647D656|nr:ExbD/TolR family protein [Methylotenera versatilis]